MQLRDCLIELFGVDAIENGLSQAIYLLETFRRLLADEYTKLDFQGIVIALSN